MIKQNSRERVFTLRMEDVFMGETSVRDLKRKGTSEKIGELHFVKILYIGGFVTVQIEQLLLEDLPKANESVTAIIEMEPCTSAEHREWRDKESGQMRSMDIIQTGFENFRYVAFEPSKK